MLLVTETYYLLIYGKYRGVKQFDMSSKALISISRKIVCNKMDCILASDSAGDDVPRGKPRKSSRGRRGNKRSQTVDVPVQPSFSNTSK